MEIAEPPRWLGPAALGLVLLAAALVLWRTAPPAPEGPDAPADAFSAARAAEALREVLGDERPHPAGSEASQAVRGRIVARLRALGLEPKELTSVVCGRYGVCAEVTNVVARRAGTTERPGPLLCAHHDSVGAGPGASDDGMGVAVLLEVARALVSQPPLERPVIFLFTDGEEAGLLGAEAFVRDRTELARVLAVLNVEARGTDGASLMFETSDGNGQLVAAFGTAAPRPVTSSLFYSVYSRMPNDSDLSVFKRAELAGLNFAVVGGVSRYHTARDDLAHLDRGSLQHQGDNVLATARELGSRKSELGRADDAVFFDVLALGVVSWPLGLAPWLSAGATLLALLALGLWARSGALRISGVLRASFAWPLALAAAPLVGYGLLSVLRALDRLPTGWPARPLPLLVALAAAGLVALSASLALRSGSRPWEEWAAALVWWTLANAFVTAALPAAGFGFLLVVSALGLAGIVGLAARSRPLHAVALLLPLGVALVLWAPVLRLAYDAVGFEAGAIWTAVLALALSTALPVAASLSTRSRRRLLAASATAGVIAAAIGALLPHYSAQSPQRLSLAFHHDASSGTSRWLVDASSGRIPAPVLSAGGFGSILVSPSPWAGGWLPRALAAPAEPLALSPPVLDVVADERRGTQRVVRLRARSTRGARHLTLHLPRQANVSEVRVAGERATVRPAHDESTLTYLGDTRQGVEIELTFAGELGVQVSDHTPGLPPAGNVLDAARPDWAVPSQLGDATVVSARSRL